LVVLTAEMKVVQRADLRASLKADLQADQSADQKAVLRDDLSTAQKVRL